jgi:DDE superfamily endonuclease
MSFPSPIITVLAHFQPLFTAPTRKKVVTLLIGTLLARGRRTVTAALRQMGHQMDGQFSLFHQVLNRARWSWLEVIRHLLQVLVCSFVTAGGSVGFCQN